MDLENAGNSVGYVPSSPAKSSPVGSIGGFELSVKFRFRNAAELEAFLKSPQYQAMKSGAAQKWWGPIQDKRNNYPRR